MTDDQRLQAARDSVRAAVLAGIAHQRMVRRRGIALIGIGASLLLGAAASLGATHLITASQLHVDTVALCYKFDDLEHEPMPVVFGGEESVDTVDIVITCLDLYDSEFLTMPRPEGIPADAIPEIAACLDPSGVGAGFPIWDDEEPEELCHRLGLPVWDPSMQTQR